MELDPVDEWFLDEDGNRLVFEEDGQSSPVPPAQGFPTPYFNTTLLKSGKPPGEELRQVKVLIANAGGMPHNTSYEWQVRTELDQRLAINTSLVSDTSDSAQRLAKKKQVYLPKGVKLSPRRWQTEWTPEGKSSIDLHTISHAYVHQAFRYEPEVLAQEMKRVCMPGVALP